MAKLKVTQVKSTIGTKRNHRESLRTLGLRKIRQSTVREDTPEVRGLIATTPPKRPARADSAARCTAGEIDVRTAVAGTGRLVASTRRPAMSVPPGLTEPDV